jgi:uncharacterized membrane protein (UPF0127 family)
MKLKIVALVGFLALLLVGAELAPDMSRPHFDKSTMRIDLAGGQHVDFAIEVARTPAQQEYGLMFQRHLEDHAGMIFIEEPPQVMAMWMKNTYIPLDMLFVGSDGTILSIAPNAVPKSEDIISSGDPVAAVIELAGGAAVRLGIKPGDKISSPAFQVQSAQP